MSEQADAYDEAIGADMTESLKRPETHDCPMCGGVCDCSFYETSGKKACGHVCPTKLAAGKEEFPPRRYHELKVWPEQFQALKSGRKTYEVRKADRDFRLGDVLLLREWNPEVNNDDLLPVGYVGSEPLVRVVQYMTGPGQWGLPGDVCVLGLGPGDMDEDLTQHLRPQNLVEMRPPSRR